MTIIICGIPKGFEKAHRCPYCGFESDDIEDFAVAMCWDCLYENTEEETDEA